MPHGEKGAKLTLIFLVAVIGLALIILIAQGTGLL